MAATVFKSIPLILPSSGPPRPLTTLDISTSSTSISPDPSTGRPFQRLRSSLEQTLRTATRPRKSTPPDDITTTSSSSGKGKEKTSEGAPKEKGKSKMLQHLPSKVAFRRGARETASPIPPSGPVVQDSEDEHFGKVRIAGVTSYQTPSLRQASISSPALHLSSQAVPSLNSQSAVPASSFSSTSVLVSPRREQSKKPGASLSHREISTPLRLGSRREKVDPVDSFNEHTSSRHRVTKSTHTIISPSPSTPSLPSKHSGMARSGERVPMSRLERELPSPPDALAPNQAICGSSKVAGTSSGMCSSVPLEPNTPTRAVSPIRARSPTVRSRVVSPPSPSSPSPTPRKPYIDQSRRISPDASRRVSSPTDSRTGSPSPVRRRVASPVQQSYAQNRHFKIVSGSLEHRELIRTATSMLCREMIRRPPHMSKTESGMREWEEVERRMRALTRLERVWGKSGTTGQGSPTGSILSPSGEERERRLFGEALKDGFVLCQLINKLRSCSMVRPDPREDGIFRSSNVTKFLAACASHGLPGEELFQPDDLTGVTSEPLARVAKTIIALINFVDSPLPSKVISGQGKKVASKPVPIPYQGSVSRGSASTPNLLHHSPPSSPTRRRWTPPSALPTVRSNSSEEDTCDSSPKEATDSSPDEHEEGSLAICANMSSCPVTRLMAPPRSALRPRPVRQDGNSGTSSAAADSGHTDESQDVRQSVASSNMTETTATTVVSSILDNSRSWNKFGTIRTVTTDFTSETPSLSRTEGSSIIDDPAWRKSLDGGSKFRDRRLSETPADLTRVAEETDESISSRGHANKDEARCGRQDVDPPRKVEKTHAVHLHKGRWPDDFMDVFGNGEVVPNKTKTPPLELYEELLFSSSLSASPQQNTPLSGQSLSNENSDVPPKPPRKTHRLRHSIDNPVLLQKGTLLRRETNPDGVVAPKAMLRRHSTKPNVEHRNAIYLPRCNSDNPARADDDSIVPFPQAKSIERASGRATPIGESSLSKYERPRFPRGRFQSDVEESLTARRRVRPNAEDILGRPRSRIESMVSLGVSSNASASDLLRRESVDYVRKTIIVKEEGKPPVQYQLGNCIGRGQFGSVYRALNLSTGQTVAVKQIRLEGLKEFEVAELMREVNIYKRLSHPGIVRYEGMARDEETLSIVLEYVENGSLGQTLKAFGRLNERLVASYVVKILEGLHYLHGQDVVHCDLKAANILTTKTGNVKLTDFGVSLNLRAMEREMKNVAGTPNWMAPEIIELKGASIKSDIWSLACTIIELLTGRPPYGEISNSMSVMFHIVEDKMPPIPEECSDLACDFLTQCFNKDPTKRPSAETLFEHQWLKRTWGIHKELRPQDSIPFLRRVSADLQKSEAVRYISQAEMPGVSSLENVSRSEGSGATQPPIEQARLPSVRQLGESDISPREHSFVKTTFSKPMLCRVCLMDVKKSAVICAQCSLIAHSKCTANAPPTCDLRAQLLLYAQYAEKGNSSSLYYNPADALGENRALGALSDIPYVVHSDVSQSTPASNSTHPPTGFKFISAFKRSRSNVAEQNSPTSAQATSGDDKPAQRRTLFRARNKERPHSVTSNSTGVSSLRSANTAAESFSSGPDARRSRISSTSMDRGAFHHGDSSEAGNAFVAESNNSEGVPGSLPSEIPQYKKRDSNSNCIVQ
ncbi:hypothetical protein AX15_003105 [Amanita polypyramis BW_CC]|nr:hypothetical protein AX15_003105 [Amanita polypyramis BW_CC]